ncbi:RNA polymerase sigma factor [Paenibacillus mendelii]|uniref:RNA polymerase sigma factor n=1 Tax=Paenibacillus mendelii TaxID=206163 RepID=A0ABV6J6E2_9BACL|nr:RNA polymerase sigma factor [Paenibacillus mendelii]MCQ6561177.1 RNA polymerase sigma factor [Paenibacillus mendelii]
MNKELFQELYGGHSRKVFAYLLGRTTNKEAAADLLQDTFLRVWNRIETVRGIPEDQQLHWIFAIASNLVKDHYRKSTFRKKTDETIRAEQIQPTGDLSQWLVGREQFRELEAAINELPEELRCILLMKVIGGMNSFQISDTLNIPAGTVRYRIAQARRLIANQLQMLPAQDQIERRKPNG